MAFGILYGLRMSGIYKIVNKTTGKFYIGSSVQIESRIFKHLSFLRRSAHPNKHLQSAFSLYGEDAFDYTLLERCEISELLAREQHYIDLLSPEYNICKVAGNTLGVKHTQEAKAKMTAANMGNSRMLGKSHTEETKRLIGALASQRTHSDEAKAKIAKSLIGNKRTAGSKLSDAHKAIVARKLKDSWSGRDGVKPRSREDAAVRARARWADPIWKAQQSEKIRQGKAARRLFAGLDA